MNREAFIKLCEQVFDRIRKLTETKGKDYAPDHETNEFQNFDEAAARLDLRPEQVWAVYAGKHWDAIMAYCREGQVHSEPVAGRVEDLILYLLLLAGMDERRQTQDREMGL